ncbi:MAG: fatty acid desaturase [Microcoleaceae cyanobacterium]
MFLKKWINWQRYYEQGTIIYLVLLCWFLYLLVVPYIYSINKVFGIVFVLFPGVYLLSLIALFMHESWHGYFQGIPNRTLFFILSWIVFTDPQIFDLVHPSHHNKVNTYEDLEFHPFGKINNKIYRVIYNCMQILFGSLFLLVMSGIRLSISPKTTRHYRFDLLIISVVIWLVILCGFGYASSLVFQVSLPAIPIPYLLTIWFTSFIVHHNELIEHGNLIVEGNWKVRNSQTRNLQTHGILEKLFLILIHQDCREHLLHHTSAKSYNRPFVEKYTMPENAVYISMTEYIGILKRMVLGEESVVQLSKSTIGVNESGDEN